MFLCMDSPLVSGALNDLSVNSIRSNDAATQKSAFDLDQILSDLWGLLKGCFLRGGLINAY